MLKRKTSGQHSALLPANTISVCCWGWSCFGKSRVLLMELCVPYVHYRPLRSEIKDSTLDAVGRFHEKTTPFKKIQKVIDIAYCITS